MNSHIKSYFLSFLKKHKKKPHKDMSIICGYFKGDILILCSNKKNLNFNQVKN
jgi:hypothetical protein